jgi:hypothetical protein
MDTDSPRFNIALIFPDRFQELFPVVNLSPPLHLDTENLLLPLFAKEGTSPSLCLLGDPPGAGKREVRRDFLNDDIPVMLKGYLLESERNVKFLMNYPAAEHRGIHLIKENFHRCPFEAGKDQSLELFIRAV